MGAQSQRRAARKRRERRAREAAAAPSFDVHTKVVLDSVASMERLFYSFAASEDRAGQVESAFQDAVDRLVTRIREFDAIRLIEVSRLAFLQWSFGGRHGPSSEAVAAHVELLALIALSAGASGDSGGNQVMSHFASETKDELTQLVHLSQLRALTRAEPTDKLSMISMLIQGNEVWIRNTSYPDKVEATLRQLFDGHSEVKNALVTDLGFSVNEAFAVLEGCHSLQQDKMNSRLQEMFESVDGAMMSTRDGGLAPAVRESTRAKFNAAWEPEADAVTVRVEEIVTATGLTEDCVRAVVDRFRLDLGTATPAEVVGDFVAGKNPLRTRPVLTRDNDRIMLPHNALIPGAIKENFELHLKSSPSWSVYADHRGHLLESRTKVALERILPGATHRDGFEYYLPATPEELAAGDPTKYTKRAEGDHLVLLDDVAFIVEDKAVALSELSRGGKVNRIRTDLTGIITKAAEQAGRLRDLIERDRGVRIKGEGWVDLSHIREIHTIAVSLDDLSSVATATAELVRAGLLPAANICWTVSLHDLELITELVDRPAEFLLYLRRRRNPNVTVLYTAPDELDLFLYYFESGLWVEPNPDEERVAFPFLPEPTTSERRRYRKQVPTWISSRTDTLDQWHHAKVEGAADAVSKPTMVVSPLAPLIDSLQAQGTYGWLSIGATLLSGATRMQSQIANAANKLLANPRADGRGRSITWPLTGTVDPREGWLLVFATRTASEDPAAAEQAIADYLKAKKHQLSLPRAVGFLYDAETRQLQHVRYVGDTGDLAKDIEAHLSRLRPQEEWQRRLPPPRKPRRKKTKRGKR